MDSFSISASVLFLLMAILAVYEIVSMMMNNFKLKSYYGCFLLCTCIWCLLKAVLCYIDFFNMPERSQAIINIIPIPLETVQFSVFLLYYVNCIHQSQSKILLFYILYIVNIVLVALFSLGMIIYLSCTDYNGTTLFYLPLLISSFFIALISIVEFTYSLRLFIQHKYDAYKDSIVKSRLMQLILQSLYCLCISIKTACDVLSLYYPHFLSFNYSSFSSLILVLVEYISPLILLILIAHNYDEIIFNKSKSIPDNHSYDIAKSFLDAHSLDLDYTDTQNSNPLPSLNNPDVKVENIFDDPNRYDDLLSEQANSLEVGLYSD